MNLCRSLNERIALGTVQFGMSYGVANKQGQVEAAVAAAILSRAIAMGIDTIDTAVAYGSAEKCLGAIGVKDLRVVTKLPGLPSDCERVFDWAESVVYESLARLNVEKIQGLILHRSSDLLGSHGAEVYDALNRLKAIGLVEKIGISVYSPDELDAIFARYVVDLVQAPFNILDRRLLQTGWLDRLHKQGVEVHVRSVFLQGLLLMNPSLRPAKFKRWQQLWDRWDNWLSSNNLSPLAVCLRYPLSHPGVNRVVVGVDSFAQFEEVMNAVAGELPVIPDEFYTNDIDLINPGRWSSI